jgi:hypothetical protein
MDALLQVVKAKTQTVKQTSRWSHLRQNWRTVFQIANTIIVGMVVPFGIYVFLGSQGWDISWFVYVMVVVALLATALLIWGESLLALRQVDPLPLVDPLYPPASAIIAAYLPNEAATIESTLQSFLRLDYPGRLQIILAYNTPRDMPIERIFHG